MKNTTSGRKYRPTAKDLKSRGFVRLSELKYDVPGPKGSVLLPAGEKNVWVKFRASGVMHDHDGVVQRCNVYYKAGKYYYGMQY